MKIKGLQYYDHAKGWRLEPVEFSNLNLLVGVSGAGKTKILDAILSLQKIAEGESLNGVEWEVIFSTKDNEEYIWRGQFNTIEKSDTSFIYESGSYNQSEILTESLLLNQKTLVERESAQIKFDGKDLPKLSAFESVIKIFKNEKLVEPVSNGFRQINHSDETMVSQNQIYPVPFSSLLSKYTTEEEIINSELRTQVKLALVYRNVPQLFDDIKGEFVRVFPTVEDIKIEPFNDYATREIPNVLKEFPFVYIKEQGVESWIEQGDISSGMYRTIIHIAELYLSPKGTLVIIDEFENSLGINCIDAVTEDLMLDQGDLQFILTSHHPYIINNIPMDYWKIVTRKGGVVTVRNAKELNLGRSKHQAYLQLINKLLTYNEEAEFL